MLKINNGLSDFNGNDDDPGIIIEPGDPNSPIVPFPGEEDLPTHPPTENELKAVTGGSISGIINELPSDIATELAMRGINVDSVKSLAVAWGVNMAQAGAIALARTTATQLNRMFKGFSGGSDGPPPFMTFSGPNMSDGGSGPGGPVGPGDSGGPLHHDPRLHNHLDTNGKPGEVTIEVGLDVRAYVPYYKEYSATYTSPLHLTGVIPVLPDSTSYPLGRFQDQVVLLRFIERVSRSVSYNLSAATINTTNIREYFNNVLLGLSYYYWCESIYAYSMNKLNTNQALTYLRREFTPDILNDLMVLRGTLASLPIPPNMLQYVCWMFQNWSCNSLGDSPIIKCCPFPVHSTGYIMYGSNMRTVNAALTNDSARALTSVLVKAFDDWWKIDLPPSSPTLEHNTDFLTFWSNLPVTTISSVAPTITTQQPSVSTFDQSIVYHTYSDELDGFITGLATVWDGTRWAPNLMTPVLSDINGNSNRHSWTGTVTLFQKVWSLPHISIQRPETYRIMPTFTNGSITIGPINTIHDVNSERLIGININSISDMGYLVLQWLFNFETVDGFSPKAGGVMRSAPRGKAINESKSYGSKPNKGWAKPKKQRNASSPEIEAAIDSSLGEL